MAQPSTRTSALAIPASVAVIGASPVGEGNYYGARLLTGLTDAAATTGGQIRVYAVNPKRAGSRIGPHQVYASLADLPEVPDLVGIVVGPSAALRAVDEAGALGVRTAVVITNESSSPGARHAFDDALAQLSRRHGIRVIGPNSVGLLNGTAGLNCSFATGADGGALKPGDIAILSQSGAILSAALQVLAESTVGFSWLVSSGDEAGAGFEELFADLVADAGTNVILLFAEGFRDGVALRRAAQAARRRRTAVVLLATGLSQVGRSAVESHTGRMAGSDQIYQAFADESGIVRARTFAELFDFGRALSQQSIPRRDLAHGRRAIVLSSSGGIASSSADHLTAAGWTLPPLDEATTRRIHDAIDQHVVNPMDLSGVFGTPQVVASSLLALRDVDVDAIFFMTAAGGTRAEGLATAVARVRDQLPQELYVGWVGLPPTAATILDRAGVTAFADLRRAVEAAQASASFRDGAHHPTDADLTHADLTHADLADAGPADAPTEAAPAPLQPAIAPVAAWPRTSGQVLADLQSAGIDVAAFRVVPPEPRAAIAAAAEVGFPVVLKVESRDLLHKSDRGGVELAVTDADDLAGRLTRLEPLLAELPDAQLLVQSMRSGLEVFLGFTRDHAFGPVLVAGLGGTLAELQPTPISLLLPTTPAALRRALLAGETPLARLLRGYRGQRVAGEAVVTLAAALIDWILALGPRVESADFNPVIVDAHSAIVVDARVLGRA